MDNERQIVAHAVWDGYITIELKGNRLRKRKMHFGKNRSSAGGLRLFLLISVILGGGLHWCRASALKVEVAQGWSGAAVRILDGANVVFWPLANAELGVAEPAGFTGPHRMEVSYPCVKRENGVVTLSGGEAPGLTFTETFQPITSDLTKRVLRATAQQDQRYYLELGWKAGPTGDFYSFRGKQTTAPRTRRSDGHQINGNA